MGEFNSDDNYICYYGQESHRRNGVTLIINKRVHNTVFGCNLKNDRIILVHFQGKPFNITVIQIYAPSSNAEEAFLSLLALLWNSAFRWVYISFSPLLFVSFLFSAICKASSDSYFAFLHFFSIGMVLIPVSCTMS